jgi:transcriptional regulator with XRE-family HTH domain
VSDEDPTGPLADKPEIPIGATLAQFRKRRKVSGNWLSRQVGMSQSRISRIETGRRSPSAEELVQLARALDIPKDQLQRLLAQAEQVESRLTDWRLTSQTLRQWQQQVAELERRVGVLRIFQPNLVIGLLQTSEYARTILTSAHELVADTSSASTAAEALTLRVQRQEILADPTKLFHFVMTESVLEHQVNDPEHMSAQIQRIRAVAAQDNVTLGIIPTNVRWTSPPPHGFHIFDNSHVVIDLYNTVLTLHGRGDVTLYQRLFDHLIDKSTVDIEAILQKHLSYYNTLATGTHRPRAN